MPFCTDSWTPKSEPPKQVSKRQVEQARKREQMRQQAAHENMRKVCRETGHDYLETSIEKPSVHDEEIKYLHKRVNTLENENLRLKCQVFSLEVLKLNDEDFQGYTNLPNYGVFKALSDYLLDVTKGNLNYWRGSQTNHQKTRNTNKPGPDRRLTFEEEFFMILVKLKTGDFNCEIARKFGISESHISKTFSTWINLLLNQMRFLFEMKTNWDDIHR